MSTQANLARASEEPSKKPPSNHIQGPGNLGARMRATTKKVQRKDLLTTLRALKT